MPWKFSWHGAILPTLTSSTHLRLKALGLCGAVTAHYGCQTHNQSPGADIGVLREISAWHGTLHPFQILLALLHLWAIIGMLRLVLAIPPQLCIWKWMEVINPLPNSCHGTGEMPNSEQAQPIAVDQVLLGVCGGASLEELGPSSGKALIEKRVWTPCSDSFVTPPHSHVIFLI